MPTSPGHASRSLLETVRRKFEPYGITLSDAKLICKKCERRAIRQKDNDTGLTVFTRHCRDITKHVRKAWPISLFELSAEPTAAHRSEARGICRLCNKMRPILLSLGTTVFSLADARLAFSLVKSTRNYSATQTNQFFNTAKRLAFADHLNAGHHLQTFFIGLNGGRAGHRPPVLPPSPSVVSPFNEGDMFGHSTFRILNTNDSTLPFDTNCRTSVVDSVTAYRSLGNLFNSKILRPVDELQQPGITHPFFIGCGNGMGARYGGKALRFRFAYITVYSNEKQTCFNLSLDELTVTDRAELDTHPARAAMVLEDNTVRLRPEIVREWVVLHTDRQDKTPGLNQTLGCFAIGCWMRKWKKTATR